MPASAGISTSERAKISSLFLAPQDAPEVTLVTLQALCKNIATGETSQTITSFTILTSQTFIT